MKTCTICNELKSLSEFGNRARSSDGKTSWCKPCKRGYDNQHYKDNPDRRGYIRENSSSRREQNRKLMIEYLSDKSCIDCGESNIIVLEFDHRENKSGSVGTMVERCSWETVIKEIAKCDIRCANCHRIKTARDFGWYKFAHGTTF